MGYATKTTAFRPRPVGRNPGLSETVRREF
jgi:hypothetical protein